MGEGVTVRTRCNARAVAAIAFVALALIACEGPQSALDPAGYDARRLAELFWVMCAGGAVIWIGVIAIALYAAKRNDAPEGAANFLILGGGVLLSIAVLTALLVYGLMLMGSLRAYSGAG